MFSRESSSRHTINSDYPLSKFQKVLYVVLNFALICFPSITRKFKICKFQPRRSAVQESISQYHEGVTPSRCLSNLFWAELNWPDIQRQIGEPIDILEVGCGTGRYGTYLNKIFPINSYTGIDLYESDSWPELKARGFNLHKESFENFSKIATTQNVVITQSALEHFDRDLLLMTAIGKYAQSREGTTFAIHIFPSSACLFTFLFHGIRQYNKRTINSLVKASRDPSSCELHILGGPFSNLFHFTNVTLRSLILKRPLTSIPPSKYFRKLEKSVILDNRWPFKNSASFYALVLQWKN
jgi:hypothetical protein